MPTLKIKVDCKISANCVDEDEYELGDDEWREYLLAKQSDRAQQWVKENLIDPEMVNPEIIIDDGLDY